MVLRMKSWPWLIVLSDNLKSAVMLMAVLPVQTEGRFDSPTCAVMIMVASNVRQNYVQSYGCCSCAHENRLESPMCAFMAIAQ